MWLRGDRWLINLNNIDVISVMDNCLVVYYQGDNPRDIVKRYETEEDAKKALDDLQALIEDAHSIPFAENNVVFTL